ncbi:MAG: hypothetical protein WAU86_11725 [Oricola sp.]
MSSRIVSAMRAILAATILAAPVSIAQAADMIAPGPYMAAAPDSECAKANYLSAIEKRFHIQANEVHHRPDLAIVSISNIRENNYLPIQEDISSVERRYCQAAAGMSDGETRTLWYLIEYSEGFAGAFGDNVEFCVSGLDRWNVYDGHCRVLR